MISAECPICLNMAEVDPWDGLVCCDFCEGVFELDDESESE